MQKQNLKNPNIAYGAIKYGLLSLVAFFIIFGFWAAIVPIKSAAIADGTIVLDFNRKTIQHLEGGIIENILVQEGQMVNEGDVLLYLNDIKAKSEQQIVKKRLYTMKVQRERLLAERANKKPDLNKFFIEYTANVKSDEEKKEAAEVVKQQGQLFNTKIEKLAGEIRVLHDKLHSYQGQAVAARRRLKILSNELKAIKPLVKEKNLPVLRQYDIEKQIAELQGILAQSNADAAAAKKQIDNYKNEDLTKTLDELKETELEIVNLTNQLENAKDVLKRSEILAPVAGRVMNIKFHTIGAVVPPGGEIMNIVPQDEELIVEAKVKPQDIDEVFSGLKAKVMLTAYKGKKVPKLNGVVFNVSPDITTNEQTRESYFLVRVKISKDELKNLKLKINLYPGMPAQVFIITGSRTVIDYLFDPIKDAAYKAFREQ